MHPKPKSDSQTWFYNYTCKLVLQHELRNDNKNTKLIFDKKGPRDFYTKLRKYLTKVCELEEGNRPEIKSRDSKKDKPLQIVDMIAGAIGRSF